MATLVLPVGIQGRRHPAAVAGRTAAQSGFAGMGAGARSVARETGRETHFGSRGSSGNLLGEALGIAPVTP